MSGVVDSMSGVVDSMSGVVDDDQTRKSKFEAPPVLGTPGIGEGAPDDGSALRSDQLRAITPSATVVFDAATQQRLRDANIVQLPDGIGIWMIVEE